jgi:hypothetical protein
MTMRIWPLILALSLWLAPWLDAHASAQTNPADKAAAEALFDRGLGLLRDGKTEEACRVLEQSQAVEAGIGTMLYLADCYERLGRTASAWALFREAASQASAAGQEERARAGRQRAERLEPGLATLVIDVPAPPADAPISVMRAGASVPSALFGVKAPVDPGTLMVEAHAPGYAPYTTSVVVPAQGQVRVALPALEKLPPSALASPAGPSTERVPSAPQPDPTRLRRIRLGALGVGAAGVAAALVGGALGVRAIVKRNAANDQCPDGACPSDAALTGADRAHDSANSAARASNALWITGAVLAGSAVAVYFAAPRLVRKGAEPTQLALGLAPRAGGAALSLGGKF